ncbi:MAG: hypothetical protein EOM80_19420 [Erysipelotrichia bacterium]|nr:hypothetical protein [Erysipelotrichia bacterium]
MQGCKVLDNHEVSSLLDSTKSARDRLMILTGLSFGTRVSEALELNFSDVSGSQLSLKSKKGSNNQVFPINEQYRAAVNAARAEYIAMGWNVTADTALFLNRSGVRMTRQAASDIMRKTANNGGVSGKVNTHSLRKSFITRIYRMTQYNIAETKNYSRHKSLASLDTYLATTQTTDLCKNLSW